MCPYELVIAVLENVSILIVIKECLVLEEKKYAYRIYQVTAPV